MEWFHLAETIITSWPLAVFAIAFLLREPLARILNNIDELRYKDGKREVQASLRTAETKAQTLLAEVVAVPQAAEEATAPATESVDDNPFDLAVYDEELIDMTSEPPQDIILWAWDQLCDWITYAAEPLFPDSQRIRHDKPRLQLIRLYDANAIEHDIMDFVAALEDIRIQAVRHPEILDLADALKFARNVRPLLPVFQIAARRIGQRLVKAS